MAKSVKIIIKLQIQAGTANPAPPVGPALGQHGVNIQQFCQQFNEATKDMTNDIIPAEITIYQDRSFDFRLKTPPVSDLLRKAARPIGETNPDSVGTAGIEKGSAVPQKNKVGKITKEQLRKIAERKMIDLNTTNVEKAEKTIIGTAKSMGIEII